MKLQVAAFLSFLIMPYALADDQGGLKKDVAPRRLMLLRMVIAVRMMQKK
ncbi:Putative periplasmic protein [Salmonella enterica subsp. arizonae]|uniref:Periplasmic protein n=1 Tax=Salmonella enterica subsp. arizonae TaxID=59203 RepID=A0A2X4TR37_SALER|nr:Putative periplasmic protein [Salmonella enterica subsp. arizonae]